MPIFFFATQGPITYYRDTGIIVVDATAKNNILVYNEQIICIDVDMAFNRESLATYRSAPDDQHSYHYQRCVNRQRHYNSSLQSKYHVHSIKKIFGYPLHFSK